VALLVVGLASTAVAAEVAPVVIDRNDDTPVAVDVAVDPQATPDPSADPGALASARVVPGQLVLARDRAEEDEKKKNDPRAERLREKAERKARKPEKPAPPAPISFRVGSFNVLGSQHTEPGGVRASWPPASVRTAGAAELVGKHGVDVLGTQELQADQLRGLQGRTGMAAYPGFAWGEAETDNSILWDPGVFELVEGSQFTITFMGRPRPQAIVRLRHLATGRELYVVNTHPSAGDGRYATERRNGQIALVNVVNDLQATGLPVLVTGDMNDREAFYCNVVPAAGLIASNGGSYGNGCQPPPEPIPVDWVVGSGATWSGYWRDTTPIPRKISNHFFISAEAHIG
jgi:hypothetical protein